MSDNLPLNWLPVEREVHADCRIFKVERRRLRHPKRDIEDDFFVIKPKDWVVAIGLTASREFVLVRQFRFGSEELTWEFPSGCREAGEDVLVAAEREMREETGFVPKTKGILIGENEPNPAMMENRCSYVFFELVEDFGVTDWDEHEELEVRVIPMAQAYAWARSGVISHALMHAGLFFFQSFQETR